jgi:HD-like signal output (HDOD) protein/DNA-binding NarL/FixJ family response regulator
LPDVLIVDESEILRELLGRILEMHGYASAWVSVPDAQEALWKAPPALLILEPGPIGSKGWRLLAELSRAKERGQGPDIAIITDHSGKSEVLRAAQLGVRDYMLKKRFSVAELLTRVRRHVSPSGTPHIKDERLIQAGDGTTKPFAAQPAPKAAAAKAIASTGPASNMVLAPEDDPQALRKLAREMGLRLLTREQTLGILESAPVRTMPGVVSELIMMVSSPRGSIADIAGILRGDPVLAARVLRIANSAAFTSTRGRIATVEEAVKNIGVHGVRNLVMSVGLFDAFAAGAPGGLNVTRVWQHCLGVAILMEKLAPQDASIPPGSAYLVGLCHDLAGIVLRQQFPIEFDTVAALIQRSSCRSRLALAVTFGLPWAELVSQLLIHLRLPPIITVPIEEFFDRGDRKGASGAGSLLNRTLRAVNVYAHGLLLASGTDEPITPLTVAECNNTFGTTPPALPDDAAVRSDALSTAAVLAHLDDAQTQQMCKPLIPQNRLRLCYSRHGEYAELDPLRAFLNQTASEVTLLPSVRTMDPNTLQRAQALIVAGPRTNATDVFSQDMVILRRLVAQRPMQVLYLTGSSARCPAEAKIEVERLPINIETLGAFLGRASVAEKKAVALPAA